MSDHLTKPIDPDALADTLVCWLGSGHSVMTDQNEAIALPELEHFQVTEGMARVNQNADLYLKLLKSFREKYRALLQNLETEVTGEEVSVAHSIKGVAGNLGAQGVFQAAKELESQAREGGSLDPLVRELARQLELAVAELETLDQLETDQSGGSDAPAVELDLEALQVALTEFKTALEEQDAFCEDLFKPIEGQLKAAGFSQETGQIKSFMDDFAFEEATTVVEDIQDRLRSEAS